VVLGPTLISHARERSAVRKNNRGRAKRPIKIEESQEREKQEMSTDGGHVYM
jgi:hypothetical protein